MAGKKCKAKGGPMLVSGNPRVVGEAKEKTVGDKDTVSDNKKKRKTGGKVIGLMTGGGVRPRLDRPGRKSGGGVGANRSPLSTAHSATSQDAGSSSPTDTYGGTPK
jgi:hypothetical protein